MRTYSPWILFSYRDGQYKFTQHFGKLFDSEYQERHKTCKPLDLVIPFLGVNPKKIILNRDKGITMQTFDIITIITGKFGNQLIVL